MPLPRVAITFAPSRSATLIAMLWCAAQADAVARGRAVTRLRRL